MADLEAFRNKILSPEFGVKDKDREHHVLNGGNHGQKLDFGALDDTDDLYHEWVDVTVDRIKRRFPQRPMILLGVANGTNNFAIDASRSREFDARVVGLPSAKDEETDDISLDSYVVSSIRRLSGLVLVLEDASKAGSKAAQVAKAAQQAGAQTVEALITTQRRPELTALDEAGIAYDALIKEDMPDYTPAECLSLREGFCSQGFKLIPYGK
ncbi:MAG TPA: hypothetical protein VHB51_01170 [Candidatus Saccharimonadales bacterium]|nr:hypothetical protein [Candidatus Saccharimonadales bacterium]